MRKIIYVAAAVLAVILLVIGILTFLDMIGAGGGDNEIDIRVVEGYGLSAIADDLKGAGVISHKFAFKAYATLTGKHIYQMGIHRLNSSMSYGEIIRELETMSNQDNVTVLIPEGYELRQIADVLEKEGLVNREIFMREIESGNFDYDFVSQIPDRENRLEGYLFPDTYEFSKRETEHDIINKMLKNFENQVIPLYSGANSEMSLDDVINLASIVEKEAAHDEERGRIASVFLNRLEIGMRLESDATLQYTYAERKEALSNADTREDSPYNTYMNSGLPRGPIASPGLKSIEAVLYPEQTNYLYFMAVADGSYSVFTDNFEEHLENQRQIQGGGN